MIVLQRENVVKLAATEHQAQKYERQGFVRIAQSDKPDAAAEGAAKNKKTEGGK